MESARVDFHQFTHPGLRRPLHEIGFNRVVSIYELIDVDDLNDLLDPTRYRHARYKALPALRHVIEAFADGTSSTVSSKSRFGDRQQVVCDDGVVVVARRDDAARSVALTAIAPRRCRGGTARR